jgi:hypothetical protein
MNLDIERRWECPNCTVTALTRVARPATPYHPCKGLKGLSVPLVPAGTDCKVTATERGDYIAGDRVQLDGDGRPVMNVSVERADGSNDLTIYAPAASASVTVNQ